MQIYIGLMVALSLSVVIFGCISQAFDNVYSLREDGQIEKRNIRGGKYDSEIEDDSR